MEFSRKALVAVVAWQVMAISDSKDKSGLEAEVAQQVTEAKWMCFTAEAFLLPEMVRQASWHRVLAAAVAWPEIWIGVWQTKGSILAKALRMARTAVLRATAEW